MSRLAEATLAVEDGRIGAQRREIWHWRSQPRWESRQLDAVAALEFGVFCGDMPPLLRFVVMTICGARTCCAIGGYCQRKLADDPLQGRLCETVWLWRLCPLHCLSGPVVELVQASPVPLRLPDRSGLGQVRPSFGHVSGARAVSFQSCPRSGLARVCRVYCGTVVVDLFEAATFSGHLKLSWAILR